MFLPISLRLLFIASKSNLYVSSDACPRLRLSATIWIFVPQLLQNFCSESLASALQFGQNIAISVSGKGSELITISESRQFRQNTQKPERGDLLYCICS